MMRNMDDHDHSSLVEALLSGFVNKKDNVDAQYEPTLIANHVSTLPKHSGNC